MSDSDHVPYSRRGLENLAAALNINTAYLWVSPSRGSLELREVDEHASVTVEPTAAGEKK